MNEFFLVPRTPREGPASAVDPENILKRRTKARCNSATTIGDMSCDVCELH